MTEFNPDAKVMKPQEYKKDILLYPQLKARVPKRNIVEIECPMSRKKWHFRIVDNNRDCLDAGKWAGIINKAVSMLEA